MVYMNCDKTDYDVLQCRTMYLVVVNTVNTVFNKICDKRT